MNYSFDGDYLGTFVDNTIKKSIWIKTRANVQVLIDGFFERLKYGISLYELTQPSGFVTPLSVLTPAYLKIKKMESESIDSFKFLVQLQEFLITTPGIAFLNRELQTHLENLFRKWKTIFYVCDSYNNCSTNCDCHIEWFELGMELFARNLSFESIATQKSPDKIYFNYVFGSLFTRSTTILTEIDDFLPSYSSLFDEKNTQFLALLNIKQIGYRIRHNDNYMFLEIDNHGDRFRLAELQNVIWKET